MFVLVLRLEQDISFYISFVLDLSDKGIILLFASEI